MQMSTWGSVRLEVTFGMLQRNNLTYKKGLCFASRGTQGNDCVFGDRVVSGAPEGEVVR